MAGHFTRKRTQGDNGGVSFMNRFVFPYGIRFQEDGRIEVFPVAELSIIGRGGDGIRTVLHIDSGATTSILPARDAEILGLSLKRGKKFLVRGVSGETLIGYRHTILIQFIEKQLRVPTIFVEGAVVPRILGREGVFPLFSILFDESKRRTAFLDSEKERQTIDALFEI